MITDRQPLDANGRTFNGYGLTTQNSKIFTGSNATVVTPIFRITGTIEVLALWGVVTTVLGSAHTAAAFRSNDQTAQVDITLSTGVTLSGLTAGSVIAKKGLAAAAAVAISAAAGRINEPTTLETDYFGRFLMTQKTANVNTDIEYVYATTETPTTGAMQFFIRWYPVSIDGNIAVL